jgi:hypothetical protein
VTLAPHADPGDGLLDVVLVGEADRRRLEHSLREPAAVAGGPADFVTARARRVVLEPADARVHLDDSLWPAEGERALGGPVRLELERHAVTFLTP